MKKEIKITKKEALIIGSVLSQKLGADEIGKTFNSEQILPYINEDYWCFAICETLDEIKPEMKKQLKNEIV